MHTLLSDSTTEPAFWLDSIRLSAVIIFTVTYLVIAFGKLPGFRLDRSGAALLGASLMLGFNVLALEEAYKAIDFNTITLLLGMMIVVANLRLSGFFQLINDHILLYARYPIVLLVGIVLSAGLFSAFLVNDTVCLVITPLVLNVVIRLKRNPIPYLLAIAMASNVGSTATITGNPQNMIIGSLSHMHYGTFAKALSPVAGVGLIVTIILIALVYRHEFISLDRLNITRTKPTHYNKPMIIKSLLITAAMVILFFSGQAIAKIAIIGGAMLLFTRRVKADKIYQEIDWPLLLMFAGLFIVIAGLEKTVLTDEIIAKVSHLHLETALTLSAVTAALSNIVSNVPAILVLKPFIANLHDPQRAWLIVSMASTLAGNLTLIGSVANLIVAQQALRQGITIGFWEYFKVGAPLTILTIAFGIWWL
ncbi:MAG: anion transporter [Methylococcaceae bacterium]|jgi:Na+/H+ antiporter NhaD/arsenite permease-like protein